MGHGPQASEQMGCEASQWMLAGTERRQLPRSLERRCHPRKQGGEGSPEPAKIKAMLLAEANFDVEMKFN